jgi:DNA transformation protein and related proteins
VSRSIEDMRNLGPATARMLAEVDVLDENGLRLLGSVEAYARLKFRFGRNVSLIALYAMEAALLEIDWRDLSAESKADLKRQLEARGKKTAP